MLRVRSLAATLTPSSLFSAKKNKRDSGNYQKPTSGCHSIGQRNLTFSHTVCRVTAVFMKGVSEQCSNWVFSLSYSLPSPVFSEDCSHFCTLDHSLLSLLFISPLDAFPFTFCQFVFQAIVPFINIIAEHFIFFSPLFPFPPLSLLPYVHLYWLQEIKFDLNSKSKFFLIY